MTRIGRISADLICDNLPNPRHPRSIASSTRSPRRTPMPEEKLLHSDVTELIIKAFFHVYNTLGYGFLEKVYENALRLKLEEWGLSVGQQVPIKVYFEGKLVGDYFADLIVAGRVIVEVKADEALHPAHEAQLL